MTDAARVSTLLYGNALDSNEGGIAFCAVTLVEAPDSDGHLRRIVVDAGSSGRRQALTNVLAARGLTTSDIDAVVLTHAHWDHMQNLDMFDRAVIHAHADELAYVAAPHRDDTGTPRWTKAVLDCYDIRTVADATELLPGVVVLAAAGHSAGSIAVAVTTEAGVAVIAGDAVQSANVAVHGRNPLVFWNNAQATDTIARIIAAADIIHPGHDRAFRLSAGGAVEYVEHAELRITGASNDVDMVTIRAVDGFRQVILEPPAM